MPGRELINATQTLGGHGRAYLRERAKAARAVAPRVTAAARRLPQYGLEPGLALDITVDDDTGKPFDFGRREQRQKAEAMVDAQKSLLLIGSPMCIAFSAIQAISRARRDPKVVARELFFAQRTNERWFKFQAIF